MGEMISIKKNNEFRRAYLKGQSYVSPVLVTYVLKNRREFSRFGITTSKKIGNAVKRNRSRRIVKEAYRRMLPSLKSGYDVVFVARGKTPYSNVEEVYKHMQQHMKKAKVLK